MFSLRAHHPEDPSWFTHQLKKRIIAIQYIPNGRLSNETKE